MLNDKTVRGTHFTCVHAGPKEGWTEFRLEPPDVPMPAKGKMFLRNFLGSTGLEMSLNVVSPGKAMPFLHKHQQNDEVYVVIGGRGQRHGPGGTTRRRRCTFFASSTGPTASSRAAPSTGRRSKTSRYGRTDSGISELGRKHDNDI
jgi:hypothetical protein